MFGKSNKYRTQLEGARTSPVADHVENYLGHFLEKLQKISKKYKKMPAKGAREARPFVAEAIVCTFSIFFCKFTKKRPR